MRNTRRTNRVTISGETRCLTDWAASVGICPGTLQARLRKNLPVEQLLAKPIQRVR